MSCTQSGEYLQHLSTSLGQSWLPGDILQFLLPLLLGLSFCHLLLLFFCPVSYVPAMSYVLCLSSLLR